MVLRYSSPISPTLLYSLCLGSDGNNVEAVCHKRKIEREKNVSKIITIIDVEKLCWSRSDHRYRL